MAIDFDSVTTLIGANGTGKSTVLRALDWFFNGSKGSIGESDLYQGAAGARSIQVSVTFCDLTAADRAALTAKYAPGGSTTFTAWRTWEDGLDKFTGKALAFPPFEEVRAAESATARKEALTRIRSEHADLDIPKWTNQAATLRALDEWEAQHPEFLSDAEVSDTHFFGFEGGKRLSGVFDFVLVTADLRASEESTDERGAVIGRLLSLAIDRTAVDSELASLASEMSDRQAQITSHHLDDQLSEVAGQVSEEMQRFAAGRQLQLEAEAVVPRIPPSRIGVRVVDQAVVTSVDRQGHGLQRTLLISALKLVATRGAKDPAGSVIALAIEEPELFQHPAQARLFASVLRQLASGADSRMQVAYATHSPCFIEPRYFDQIRVIRRNAADGQFPTVLVNHASMESVAARLQGHRALGALQSRWHQVCLKNLAEAFFADAVVLVEGDHDKAVVEGVARRSQPLDHDGIVVAVANGKTGMPIPHAILAELGIPVLSVFDNDSGVRARMEKSGKDDADIEQAERAVRRENRELLRYYSVQESDYPVGTVSAYLSVTPDNIESTLDVDWPDWRATHLKLIADGRGVSGKNAATYSLVCEESGEEPSGFLAEVVGAARSLRR